MKVYFGAAVTYSRKLLPQYQKIVKTIEKLGHRVLSKQVVDPNLKIGDGLSPEELFERETKTIEKAEAVVVELTTPSWGTPLLMERALRYGKPVLALFYKETKRKIPMMIKGHPELYVDHYDEDNIKSILDHYFRFFQRKKKKIGKLIVIDGADCSGKTTQANLLIKDLKKQNFKVKFIDFPRYSSSLHGEIVSRYLRGDFGKPGEVNPYLASLAYALDRLTARKQMRDWLEEGNIVIANRYSSSNMAHQSARLPKRKRKAFLDWLYEMEYKKHKIPKEDLVIFLNVPVEVSNRLLKKRKREDLADEDVKHQEEALRMYLYLTKKFKHWEKIDCVDEKGKMRSRKAIHKMIIQALQKRKII